MSDTYMGSPVLAEVLKERRRQVHAEGWTAEHDDEHDNGEMAIAAGVYALNAYGEFKPDDFCNDGSPPHWPWDSRWWKPKDARRDLVRAAALLVAEIERLDRAALQGSGDGR